MPCYEVRTISVEFHISNIELLQKAIEKLQWKSWNIDKGLITIQDNNYNQITIDCKNSKISSPSYSEKKLSSISNSIKRSYSECVIEEIAKKQKWFAKKINATKFQLQRF